MMTDVGQRLGPYEILCRLGGGGMGVVYRAWDERLRREVAIKLLHGDYEMPGMRERFLQEARAASGLNHPNICTVFDIGEQEGDPYLVMELLEGETLKEKIFRGALSVEEIVTYAREITEGLEAAHAKGIVHRDIKPANIFLVDKPNGRSQAKVLDFGLAKIDLTEGGGWESRTLDMSVAGCTVGTLAYMSPEQARGQTLDARSDLFSLGIVMYEMATRQVPFTGTTSAMIFAQLFDHTPEPVQNWNESVPKELERIILRLLEKDRRERFQTATELLDALGRIAGKVGKGGWLRKGVAVVPLVRVPEPVARAKRLVRRGSGGQRIAGVDSNPAGRSSGTRLIRASEMRAAGLGAGELAGVLSEVQAATVLVAEQPPTSSVTAVADAAGHTAVVERRSRAAEVRPGDAGAVDLACGSSVTVVEPAGATIGVGRFRVSAKVAAVGVLALFLAGVGFLLVRSGRLRPAVLAPSDRLLLTRIQNKTGDEALDGTVLEGLEIELRQSPFLNVSGDDAYYAGLRQIASESGEAAGGVSSRRVAHGMGAKAYLYGEIRRAANAYVISVDVLNTESNDKLASVMEVASTREEIPAAIDRLSNGLREGMGEDATSIAQGSVPLEREATKDIEALHAYAIAEAALRQGRAGDALNAYREAEAKAPRFAQAQMRLAWVYQSEGAEVASANAARLAVDSARDASENVKLLAEFCYAMNASGDYPRAAASIRRYADKYPHEVDGMVGLARVLRMRGHLVEALLAAQQAYEDDPYNAAAYVEAERAMIGLDRFDGVLQLEKQAQRLGVTPSGQTLAAAYLAGKQDIAAEEMKSLGDDGSYERLRDKALYLDNSGRIAAGAELWGFAANRAPGAPELASVGASMLAQSALNRALVGSCGQAKELSRGAMSLPHGATAEFRAAMASALCGDQVEAEKAVGDLRLSNPQSTAVAQSYVPNIEAAVALVAKTPAKALDLLAGVAPYDELSLTPYLRGLAHMMEKQASLAIVDFETVLAHRGNAFAVGGTVYPMAEIGLARAAAASGDKAKSAAAYQRFAVLWAEADRGQPLRLEASASRR